VGGGVVFAPTRALHGQVRWPGVPTVGSVKSYGMTWSRLPLATLFNHQGLSRRAAHGDRASALSCQERPFCIKPSRFESEGAHLLKMLKDLCGSNGGD